MNIIEKSLLPYLTDYLGISAIHWFTDLSVSQTIEKLDLATGRSLKFERMSTKRNDNGINLQVVINLGDNCREVIKFSGEDLTPVAIK